MRQILKNILTLEWVAPATIFIVSRIFVFCIVWIIATYGFGQHAEFNQWDSESYVSLATSGYQFFGEYKGQGSYIAFYPLFPILMSGVMSVLSIDVVQAGLIISFVFGAGSAILLYYLVSRWRNRDAGLLAVLLFSFYPHGVFLTAPYTESLFMFLVLSFVLLIQTKKNVAAGAIVACAMVTKMTGGVLGLVYVYDMYRQGVHKAKIILYGMLAVLPLFLFLLFQKLKFGTFFAFMHAQSINWGHKLVFPWEGLWVFYQRVFSDTPVRGMWIQDGILLGIMLLTLIISIKKVPRNIWYIGLGVVLLTLCSNNINGMGRYMLLCIPFYFIWADILKDRKTLSMVVVGLMAMWMSLATVLFAIREIIF